MTEQATETEIDRLETEIERLLKTNEGLRREWRRSETKAHEAADEIERLRGLLGDAAEEIEHLRGSLADAASPGMDVTSIG